ncbi:OLC1v1014406C1 [Oldenlandia corymbosa var. corymbosa]|uniref:OLC1v1014406C1 n=1 Tax=Oldenlandia corymbosa var. corymbosa TaxID=529605 RepID=A0AAV1E3W4_OLDCO|nr:OLC1v1014406C1 [Oldenlandia corymbosa var. corymbosa]
MAPGVGFYDRKFEALRQKDEAEEMIKIGDYAGARNKLLKSQEFFHLDHIVSMQSVCDILSAYINHIPGCDIDYYRILRLNASSTTQDINLQYNKFVTLLQPIKGSFPGTELALQFVEKAFSVLSNDVDRADFDSRRMKAWSLPDDCIETVGKRGDLSLEMNHHHGLSSKAIVLCPTADNVVSEVDMDIEVIDVDNPPTINQLKNASKADPLSVKKVVKNQDFYNFDDDRKIEEMEEGQIWATRYQSNDREYCRYAQILTISITGVTVMRLKPVPVSDRQRRWCEAGLPVACGSFSLDAAADSGTMMISPVELSHKCNWQPALTPEQFSIYPRKGEVWAVYEDWNLEIWSNNPGATKSCRYKLVEVLSDLSKETGLGCACLEKVQGFRSIFRRQQSCIINVSPSMLYSLSHRIPAIRLTGKEIDGVDSTMLELDLVAVPSDMITQADVRRELKDMISAAAKSHSVAISKTKNSESSNLVNLEASSSHVNAFRVFGNPKLLNDISTGQVWATYWGKHSMPRRYVLIQEVVSRTQLRVAILEPEPTRALEFGWKRRNLPITCGKFRAGRSTLNLEKLQLSHSVRFEKYMSVYKIDPAKGEIWAMYENWNCKWEVSDLEKSQYWIVEILSEFSEESKRIMVARLKEVEGCLTFFQRLQSDGFSLISEIPKTEILRFSHRISFCKVPGISDHGIPENAYHLEPTDLPPKRSKLI